MAAHGHAVGQPGHPHPEGAQEPGEIDRRGLPLCVRIGGHDDFLNAALCHTGDKLADAKVVRAHMVHGGEHAVEDVVQPVIFPGALHRHHVSGVGHHAHRGGVPPGTGADAAGAVPFGEILAHRAACNGTSCGEDCLSEGVRLLRGQIQHMEGQPLGGFGTDAGEAVEVLHQRLQSRG